MSFHQFIRFQFSSVYEKDGSPSGWSFKMMKVPVLGRELHALSELLLEERCVETVNTEVGCLVE